MLAAIGTYVLTSQRTTPTTINAKATFIIFVAGRVSFSLWRFSRLPTTPAAVLFASRLRARAAQGSGLPFPTADPLHPFQHRSRDRHGRLASQDSGISDAQQLTEQRTWHVDACDVNLRSRWAGSRRQSRTRVPTANGPCNPFSTIFSPSLPKWITRCSRIW